MFYEEFLKIPIVINKAWFYTSGEEALKFILEEMTAILKLRGCTELEMFHHYMEQYYFHTGHLVHPPCLDENELHNWLMDNNEDYYDPDRDINLFKSGDVKPYIKSINEIINASCDPIVVMDVPRLYQEEMLTLLQEIWSHRMERGMDDAGREV